MGTREVFIGYKNTSIEEYIYDICMPPGWEGFFAKKNVRSILRGIGTIIGEALEDNDELQIFPKLPYLMYALFITPPEMIKVIIIGQDPYHGKNQAMGMSFSVQKDTPLPSSLRNIFNELIGEGLMTCIPEHGLLTKWAKQGVLMINAAFTVIEDSPNSHASLWTEFTSELLTYINKLKQPMVALLWGKYAHDLGNKYLSCEKIMTTHPSGLSARKKSKTAPAFIGSGCFQRANKFLVNNDLEPVNWVIYQPTTDEKPKLAEKQPSKYASFMKNNIKEWKKNNPDASHRDAFKSMAALWGQSPENPKNGGINRRATKA